MDQQKIGGFLKELRLEKQMTQEPWQVALKDIKMRKSIFVSAWSAPSVWGQPGHSFRKSEIRTKFDLMMHGGSRVSLENLSEPIKWYEQIRDNI